MREIISTAHPQTFDAGLLAFIERHIPLIVSYNEHDAELEADRRSGGMKYIMDTNPISAAYLRFREELAELFTTRTVRCWHYTRLTEDEIATIRADGVAPGTLESMTARLARQVAAGRISEAEQAEILASSPIRDPKRTHGRLGTFWVTDRAVHPSNGGVELLLGHWGGEVVYFHLESESLITRLRHIGRPVVLELAVPVALTTHAFSFAESALSAVTEILGYSPQLRGVDAYLTRPLDAEGILAIHSLADLDHVMATIEAETAVAREAFAGAGNH